MTHILKFALAGALGLAVSQSAALAQKTPNHVYQAVGMIEAYAKAYRTADFVPTAEAKYGKAPPLKPRHVLFRLVMLNSRVDLLRHLHGLPDGTSIPIKPEAITPGHVAAAVTAISGNIAELSETYGLGEAPAVEPLGSGKSPGDVYKRVEHVFGLIDGLFLPGTAPNDVYQWADTAFGEARLIMSSLGVIARPPSGRVATPSPLAVYNAVIEGAEELAEFAKRYPDIAPSGGVAIPQVLKGKVSPGDVACAVGLLLADLHEMRVKSGGTQPFTMASVPTGMIPADVGARIGSIRDLIAN